MKRNFRSCFLKGIAAVLLLCLLIPAAVLAEGAEGEEVPAYRTDVTEEDFREAVLSDIPDYEDALLAANANRNRADCIVTRNVKDFAKSPIKAVTPAQFLKER